MVATIVCELQGTYVGFPVQRVVFLDGLQVGDDPFVEHLGLSVRLGVPGAGGHGLDVQDLAQLQHQGVPKLFTSITTYLHWKGVVCQPYVVESSCHGFGRFVRDDG